MDFFKFFRKKKSKDDKLGRTEKLKDETVHEPTCVVGLANIVDNIPVPMLKASTSSSPPPKLDVMVSHSSFSPMENIISRPNQYPDTLIAISTAHELMPGPSTSAPPKLDANDGIVSTSSSSETNKARPSSSSLADTSALEHGAPNMKVQSRICKAVTIGQDQYYKEVCDFLKMTEVGMVGIYGMAGVGKTTLLRKVRNEFFEPSNFNVIWIVVSATVNMRKIQKSIMDVLKLSFREDDDTETRGIKINKSLHNDRRNQTALLLDNIWEFIDLETLGVAGGLGLDSSRFKIVFTTRSQDVWLQMKPDEMITINCLGPEDSWDLFKQAVGEKTLYSQRIEDLAREVADECGGLPLALTVVGKAMVCKTRVGAWEDALNNLRNRRSLVAGIERDLYERLKFSYDNLEKQDERDCFLFCCMYPEDKEINIELLIDSWIGECLLDINSYDTYQKTCNRGLSIVDTLVAKSLLLTSDYQIQRYVTIHDVIRDMGLRIGSNKELFAELCNGGRWAYVNDSIEGLPCSELSVVHMEDSYRKTNLSSPFFRSLSFMHKLKVLILAYVRWECHEIQPSTLGNLVELRYLEISYTNLRELPGDIRNLAKLLVLKLLYNDELTRTLPAIIGDLYELRKLQIWSSLLTGIPSEVKKLKKLEIVEIKLEEGMFWFEAVAGLQHLQQLRELIIYATITETAFSEERVVHKHCLLPEMNGVCFPNLQRLVVHGLREMKRICNDDVVLPRLSEFELRDCPMLEKLPRGLMNVNRKLKGEIRGTKDWWEGLDWEDDDFKSYLEPLFESTDFAILCSLSSHYAALLRTYC